MNDILNQQRDEIEALKSRAEAAEAQLAEVKNGATGQAPCANYCEARAVEIEMRRLRVENERLSLYESEHERLKVELNKILHPNGDGPEKPSFCDLVGYVQKDLATAEQRVKISGRDLKNAEARVDVWKIEIDEMRETQFRRFNNEECWIYQGDGEDYPESLVCPVVMSADQLRSFVAAEQRVRELEKESLAFRAILNEPIRFHRDSDPMYVSGFKNGMRQFEDIYLGEPNKALNKFAIEQRVKALTSLERLVIPMYVSGLMGNSMRDGIEWHIVQGEIEQLRQQLRGG